MRSPELVIGIACAQRLSASKMKSLPRRSCDKKICTCSTPFGIKDEITGCGGESPDPPRCAQRLSASKMKSLAVEELNGRADLCSTPFGIKDEITPKPESGLAVVYLCSTPFGIKDEITNKRRCKCGCRFCAQRLSASKMKSPTARRDPELSRCVLNAFRHQR